MHPPGECESNIHSLCISGLLENKSSTNSAFCFPCRVFGGGPAAGYDTKSSAGGFRDWKTALGAVDGFVRHSASQKHQNNCRKWQEFLSSTAIDEHLSTHRAKKKELETERTDTKLLSRYILA